MIVYLEDLARIAEIEFSNIVEGFYELGEN